MAPSINITLHFLNRSRAQRIIWLLEELNLKYQLKTYKRLPDQQAPASLKSIHPLGKSPILEIDQPGRWKKPLVLAESANIVEYVTEHFGRHLIPERWKEGEEESKSPGSGSGLGSGLESEVESGVLREETLEWARYRFYMHYSEGSLMNLIGSGALKNGIKQAPVPFFIKPITKKIGGLIESSYLNHNNETHLRFLESEFASCQSTSSTPAFICGPRLTAADFMMAFPLEAAQQIAGLSEERYPLLTGYVRRVKEREACRRAVERIILETGVFEEGI